MSIARTHLPLRGKRVIGVKVWVNREDDEEQKEHHPLTPCEVKLTCFTPSCEELVSLRERLLFGEFEELMEKCLSVPRSGLLVLLKVLS